MQLCFNIAYCLPSNLIPIYIGRSGMILRYSYLILIFYIPSYKIYIYIHIYIYVCNACDTSMKCLDSADPSILCACDSVLLFMSTCPQGTYPCSDTTNVTPQPGYPFRSIPVRVSQSKTVTVLLIPV